jgi:hypothetical protein
MKTLSKIILIATLPLIVSAPDAMAGNSLPMGEARGQIRTATEMWAGLLDGRAQVKRCARTNARAVRCDVVIRGANTRCEMRISVVRDSEFDTVRARGLRCSNGRR